MGKIGVFFAIFVIGTGSAGSKALIPSLGADQFTTDQLSKRELFFSFFYMATNIGSFISTIATPIMRSRKCYGDNCFPLAFGVATAMLFVGITIYFSFSKYYKKLPPTGDLISKLIGCIYTAIKHKLDRTTKGDYDHWLDRAAHKYTGNFMIEPDMMGALNPFFVVILIPFIELVLYPVLNKLAILQKPIERMSFGMFLAALSFVLGGILQIQINKTQTQEINSQWSEVQFQNAFHNCSLGIEFNNINYKLDWKEITEKTKIKSQNSYLTKINASNCGINNVNVINITGKEKQRNTWLLYADSNNNGLKSLQLEQTSLERVFDGKFKARFINLIGRKIELQFNGEGSSDQQHLLKLENEVSTPYTEYGHGKFDIRVDNKTINERFLFRSGVVSTVVIQSSSKDDDGIIYSVITDDIKPHTIRIFFMIPQYFFLSMAECLFSISGLTFAYSQAPISMKAMIQASWFWTNAFGNLLVVILSKSVKFSNFAIQFFLYAGLMIVAMLIFIFLSWGYKYRKEDNLEETVQENDLKNDKMEIDQYSYENKGANIDNDILYTF
ncbi:DgyrCDS1380 [Dimorphilus gyrociliatus]|uniref:DgyrCDS1380 n=1 Tax=Dimorphilus gyrociliatus TaxID=2664684 RepID=A0A7I8VC74_9ANNE|nr:DgyrCDS1380 [Dimorphilus gyrociliatus]